MTQSSHINLERHLLWQAQEEPGMEHLHLREYRDRVVAKSVVVGVTEGQLVHLHYEIQCDAAHRFQMLHLEMIQPFQRRFTLSSTPDSTWRDGTIPSLNGSIDIDLSASPFTNTLPIRRLGLRREQAGDIQVAFIEIPDLAIRPEHQRYTLLQTTTEYNVYRFEHLANGFTATLRVDADGLVLNYPGLFRCVWSQ
jgi:hypothetical protein